MELIVLLLVPLQSSALPLLGPGDIEGIRLFQLRPPVERRISRLGYLHSTQNGHHSDGQPTHHLSSESRNIACVEIHNER